MRLDVFLPFWRKPKGTDARPGRLRGWLKRVGPTWLSSPVRRVVQGACSLIFLVLFFWVSWPYGGRNYAETLAGREWIDAELFLALDPLVSISTAIAGRAWVWSLTFAAGILLAGVLVPRGFCGWICPLGTLIDLFDHAIGRRVKRFRVQGDGGWVHLKYGILLATLVAAGAGVLLSGYVAAIPVVTRGALFATEPALTAILRGTHLVPPLNAGHVFSLVLFAGVLALGLLRPRFWCRYVCPTGAMFSVGNLLRASERKVESSCIHCNKCVEICPFDAIKADFTTRTLDCTLCQSCGGVCPTQSIKFVGRWDVSGLKAEDEPPVREVAVSRRGLLAAGVLGGVAAFAGGSAFGAPALPPLRPPGSVPEPDFLALCIRCEACVKACPNNVLHPIGFRGGLAVLWTPEAVPNWAGCEVTCNNCGQVCPTGAIRALPLEEKRAARMGLAIVNPETCLPIAGREACRMCVDECDAAGYRAIEFERMHVEVDGEGAPVEGSGFLAPVVVAERCVGCGLCQTRCWGINVIEKRLLADTAIAVLAGPGREDRMHAGSYRELRERERLEREAREEAQRREQGVTDEYMPEFLEGR